LRRARRTVSEPPIFARRESLRRRDLRRGGDNGCRLRNSSLRAAIARAHLDGVFEPRSCQHRRSDTDGADRPAGSRGDEVRRDAGIHRKARRTAAVATLVDNDGAINDDGFTNDHVALAWRQDHDRYAWG
jgi:hypothetical protein